MGRQVYSWKELKMTSFPRESEFYNLSEVEAESDRF